MPTQEELQRAFEEGMKHHGRGVGTHTGDGKHHAPYDADQPELLRAWLAGYQRAKGQAR